MNMFAAIGAWVLLGVLTGLSFYLFLWSPHLDTMIVFYVSTAYTLYVALWAGLFIVTYVVYWKDLNLETSHWEYTASGKGWIGSHFALGILYAMWAFRITTFLGSVSSNEQFHYTLMTLWRPMALLCIAVFVLQTSYIPYVLRYLQEAFIVIEAIKGNKSYTYKTLSKLKSNIFI